MSEENKKVELNDDDLQGVTGGTIEQKKCPAYQHRGRYNTCPYPGKGTCKQCSKCELNVD